jgi:outer membrane lipoprotein carrier protein
MYKRYVFIALTALFSFASFAYCITADEIVAKIQKLYDEAGDYTADFHQESEMGSINRVQKASGTAYFKKHGRMYWEYKEPMQQKFVSNGKKVWLYQPDMNQVQVFDYKSLNLSNTENSFLDGIGKLIQDFDVSYQGEDDDKNQVLDLKPKENTTVGFKSMRMLIDSGTYNIVKTTTTDAYGNKNTIIFKNFKFNNNIADDFFDFKVPEGVHVVTPPAD